MSTSISRIRRGAFSFLFLVAGFLSANSQVVVQDFNQLHNLNQFSGNPPDEQQVDKINLDRSSLHNPIFSLGEEDQDQFLQMDKLKFEYRHFTRSSGVNNEPFLRLSFDFSVSSADRAGKFAAFFIGDTLNDHSFYPDRKERWAQIGIFVDPDGSFALTHENLFSDGTVFEEARTVYFTGKQRISIIASNSEEDGPIVYSGPNGKEIELESGKVHIWVGNNYLLEGPALKGVSAAINGVKFLLWGNEQIASARLDNLMIARDLEIDPLPVSLLSFSARAGQERVHLDWKTVSESNSSHFVVEGSLNGEEFMELGRVKAAGNSQEIIHYTFEDKVLKTQQAGTVYYRLYQEDLDGTGVYCPAISFFLEQDAISIKEVYPNPFLDRLNVRVLTKNAAGVKIRLLTFRGKLVVEDQQQELAGGQDQQYTIYCSKSLASGVYVLEVWEGNNVRRYRVLKL